MPSDPAESLVLVGRAVRGRGGDLHPAPGQVLRERGSRPADLWGANYYPGRGREDCIEYTSLINIRPARGNPGMEGADAAVRERIRALTRALVGGGARRDAA